MQNLIKSTHCMHMLPSVFKKVIRTKWSYVQPSPADPILGLSVAYNKDPNPNKVNLGVGAYRDSNGKPYVLTSVEIAQFKQSNKDLEYGPIDGIPSFITATQKLAFGNNKNVIERTATVQTLSGTGSLRLGAEFLRHSMKDLNNPTVYLPNPTWPNHKNILSEANLVFDMYPYYNKSTNTIEFEKLVQTLNKINNKSVILFHACAHNPTGTDPTLDQWKVLSKLCLDKEHIVWFDSAYQGFASGDPEADAQSYNVFLKDGHNIMLSQSYAKNMGLYGMRVGALSLVTNNQEEKTNVVNKLKSIIRPMYSNPPIDGARIVSEIINDENLNNIWYKEVQNMASRIKDMREQLQSKLVAIGSKKDWSHITKQIGMFCYTGLTQEQVEKLVNQYHIYMTSDGRISMAGVTPKNIDYVVESIHAVTIE